MAVIDAMRVLLLGTTAGLQSAPVVHAPLVALAHEMTVCPRQERARAAVTAARILRRRDLEYLEPVEAKAEADILITIAIEIAIQVQRQAICII
jgi:hypothetical protein